MGKQAGGTVRPRSASPATHTAWRCGHGDMGPWRTRRIVSGLRGMVAERISSAQLARLLEKDLLRLTWELTNQPNRERIASLTCACAQRCRRAWV